MKLSKTCKEKPGAGQQTYAIDLFRKVTQNMLLDFRSNKYIYWYLLENEHMARTHPNLAFLGDDFAPLVRRTAKNGGAKAASKVYFVIMTYKREINQ